MTGWFFSFAPALRSLFARGPSPAMNSWMQSQIEPMFALYFKNVRFDRFRDDVDPRRVLDMLIWLADGYLHQQRALRRPLDMDDMIAEMRCWCEMLKTYAYKEEYR
mgnify:CR=1 FL=1